MTSSVINTVIKKKFLHATRAEPITLKYLLIMLFSTAMLTKCAIMLKKIMLKKCAVMLKIMLII